MTKRILQYITSIVPIGSCILLLCITYAPHILSLPNDLHPDLTVIGIYYWISYRPKYMPYFAVIVIGYVADIVANSGLGVHAFAYLVVWGVIQYSLEKRIFRSLFSWRLIGICTICLFYFIVTANHVFIEGKPAYNIYYILSLLLTIGIFPLLLGILDILRKKINSI